MFKENNTVLGILIGVPVFILSGFEHSIADIFYFCLGNVYNIKALFFIIVVILGNAFGSIMFKQVLFRTRSNKCI